jgi:hypothetical protein
VEWFSIVPKPPSLGAVVSNPPEQKGNIAMSSIFDADHGEAADDMVEIIDNDPKLLDLAMESALISSCEALAEQAGPVTVPDQIRRIKKCGFRVQCIVETAFLRRGITIAERDFVECMVARWMSRVDWQAVGRYYLGKAKEMASDQD